MARKKKEKQDQVNDDGRRAFLAWTESGRRADEEGYPVMNKKDAYAILRILLPRLDVKKELRLGSFKTMKDCVKWLGDVRGGTSWDEEMAAWESEVAAAEDRDLAEE